MKASDIDREQTADRLHVAAAEGRLLAEELEDRLDAVFTARTYGELDAIVSDLPSPRAPASAHRFALTRLRPVLAAAVALAIVLVLLIAARVSAPGHETSAVPKLSTVSAGAPLPKGYLLKPAPKSSSPTPSGAG